MTGTIPCPHVQSVTVQISLKFLNKFLDRSFASKLFSHSNCRYCALCRIGRFYAGEKYLKLQLWTNTISKSVVLRETCDRLAWWVLWSPVLTMNYWSFAAFQELKSRSTMRSNSKCQLKANIKTAARIAGFIRPMVNSSAPFIYSANSGTQTNTILRTLNQSSGRDLP